MMRWLLGFALLACCLSLLPRWAHAQSIQTHRPWSTEDDADWLRTSSGEWLRGELKEMREGSLSFDSSEFDLQTIDWDDVTHLHLPHRFVFVTQDKLTYRGSAEIDEQSILVTDHEATHRLQRSQVMTIVPERIRELSRWSYKLSWGATLRRGNTDTVDYTAFSRLRREDAFHRHSLEYNGSYGLVQKQRTTNKHRANASWNLFLSPVFFLTPVWGEAYYDEFQNIALRALLAAGGGFHAIDRDSVTLELEAAAGFARVAYLSVGDPDVDRASNDALVVPSISFHWDITDDLEFELSWMSALIVTTLPRTFHHGSTRLSMDVTDVIDFDVSALYDRQEDPVEDDQGNTPARDDLALTVGLGLQFE